MLDVLIRDGWIADGTGNPRYPADVAIAGDRIVDLGRLDDATARQVIDARDKVVCPGFVDAHSHSDWSLFANPTAESSIRQGVTTEVVGNCGESFAPFTELARAHLTDRLALYGYHGPINWASFGEYLEVIRQMGTSANLAWFVGHNPMRVASGVSGPTATEDQLREMERFARGFGRIERTQWAGIHLQGLLLDGERKSIEPLSRRVVVPGWHGDTGQALQLFVNQSPWDQAPVMRTYRALMAEQSADPEAVIIIDDTGFPKKGTHSVGVARQYTGTLGKQDNCQVGVSLHYAAPSGDYPPSLRLYLPESWTGGPAQLAEAHVPEAEADLPGEVADCIGDAGRGASRRLAPSSRAGRCRLWRDRRLPSRTGGTWRDLPGRLERGRSRAHRRDGLGDEAP